MQREITGYSIRSRGETGTGFMFVVILLVPVIVAGVVFGPTAILQFVSPVLDGVLAQVGATTTVANTKTEVPPPSAVVVPIRLPAANWDVKDGHFFTETNGQPPLSSPTGFLVSNAGGVPFWSEYQRLGGALHLGYPISQRFAWRGANVQILQRGVIQQSPSGTVGMVNILDELTAVEKDEWLLSTFFIPKPLPADFGMPDPVAARLGLLGASAPLQYRFSTTPEALSLFGLPTSAPAAVNEHVTTIRMQRTALHLWQSDGPWGKAGDVSVANAGQIALEAGLFEGAPTTPEAPPAS